MRMSGRQTPHTAGRIPEHISGDVEVLPYNQRLHGTKFKRLEGVVDTEAVLASILADLVEVLLDQLLLLPIGRLLLDPAVLLAPALLLLALLLAALRLVLLRPASLLSTQLPRHRLVHHLLPHLLLRLDHSHLQHLPMHPRWSRSKCLEKSCT